ncbi:MAG: hypothetical protein ACLQG5_00580 [Methanobacterium sp.]
MKEESWLRLKILNDKKLLYKLIYLKISSSLHQHLVGAYII